MSNVAMEVARRDSGRVPAVLGVVKDLLGEKGDASIVALNLLEALQNSASHGSLDLLTIEELFPLRGPRTIAGWEKADRFWHSIVIWCDESESLGAVQNPQLRSIMWPSCRSLSDGRRVGLSEVLPYEKTVGIPMA